jgi:hypothetical protein
MGKKTGNEAIAYRNTGTYEAPVWVEIENIRDLAMPFEKGSTDASTRGAKWRQYLMTLRDAGIDWNMLYDTEDEDFSVVQDAFFADDTQIELAIMDGDITISGTEGLRVTVDIATWTKNEPLEDAQNVDVNAKPSAKAANAPEWMTITT